MDEMWDERWWDQPGMVRIPNEWGPGWDWPVETDAQIEERWKQFDESLLF